MGGVPPISQCNLLEYNWKVQPARPVDTIGD